MCLDLAAYSPDMPIKLVVFVGQTQSKKVPLRLDAKQKERKRKAQETKQKEADAQRQARADWQRCTKRNRMATQKGAAYAAS